jgi:hypothetical protein
MATTRWFGRLSAVLAVVAAVGAAPVVAATRDLTFDERVAAQRAIESVYWSHRIWPSENSGAKPPLSTVMKDGAIREKVARSLRLSASLAGISREPISGADLQAELDRMARDTNAPATLRELFHALHDDPVTIAECLARPALESRLAAEAGLTLNGVSPSAPTGSILSAQAPDGGYLLPAIPDAGCTNDAWSLSTLTNGTGSYLPTARQLHTAVWTGAEMLVWGGTDGNGAAYRDGGIYDPATDTWRLSLLTPGAVSANMPTGRYRHTAVWTGTEMIVWGGLNASGTALNTGGRYDPAADLWNLTILVNGTGAFVPSARALHTAVWTGTEMIVWGGTPDTTAHALKNGGGFDPATDSWVNSILTNGTSTYTPTARVDHTAVWTGTEMIVWGGLDAGGNALANGGRYAPGTDAWTLSILTNGSGAYVPTARSFHTAVWTGTEMVVWGGAPASGTGALNTGGKFDPAAEAWKLTSLINATGAFVPAARQKHTAIWTGSEMIVWGGSTDGASAVMNTGGRYNPFLDGWTVSSLTMATGVYVPAARQFHTTLWTGATDQRMLVWGGSPNTHTGGLYCAICTSHTWYQDSDGDGYGNSAVAQTGCAPSPGYVALGGDCNDADPAVHPGATEVCNGIDDDCDGTVDNGGGALCSDGDGCTADVCTGVGGCSATHLSANLDITGFSAARVDGRDLEVLAAAWNTCPGDAAYNAAADLDQVPCIDLNDFHVFMTTFGQTCP